MKIDLDDEYKNLCYIQSIKPGNLRTVRIMVGILLTILTMGIPLLMYWKWLRFRNFIHNLIFEEAEKNSQEISHYLIVDSKKHQGKSRNITFRNRIVSPYLVQKQEVFNLYIDQHHNEKQHQLCKYIEHKNLRYVIKDNTLHSLHFKIKKPLSEYFKHGSSPAEIMENMKVFGKTESFLINFIHIFNKILHEKKLALIFMLFAIKKIVVGLFDSQKQQNSALVSVFILSQIILAFLLLLAISIFGARQHNKIHDKIQNRVSYQVIRNGQQSEVKLNDLCVGDIIVPKIGDIIYFKGLVCAQVDSQRFTPYAMVNQKLFNCHDKPINKIPLLSHLNQVSQASTINPGSIILNMSVKKDIFIQKPGSEIYVIRGSSHINSTHEKKGPSHINSTNQNKNSNILQDSSIPPEYHFYIIVMDNNFLQKFYVSFREQCYFDNFDPVRKSYDFQQVIFEAIFLALALIGVIIVTIDEKTKEHWIDVLLSLVVLCFPFNLASFLTFSEILSIYRLKKKNISVINPLIQQMAIADKISLELSAFQSLQFSGFIKKQRCAQMALPQKFQDSSRLFEIFRKAKQESMFTFLGWAGMMNLPYFQTVPLLKQIFQKYDFALKQKQQYDDEQNSHLRVQNKETTAIKIDWKEIQRFPISQKLIESVIIEDLYANRFENKFFAILQGEYTCDECEDYYDEVVDEAAREQYKDIMKRLFINGKKVKYISLKRLNAHEDKSSTPHFERKDVEKKLNFGGFLVFDQWPTEQSMKTLFELDNLQLENIESGVSVSIFSVRQQNALVGYDHILRKSSILFEQSSSDRASEIYLTKSEYKGVLHFGNGTLDRGSLLIADVSINKMSQSYTPADFHVSKPESILDLLYESVWLLYNSTLTIICLILFNFSKIVGQLVLFSSNFNNKVEAEPLSVTIDKIFLIDVGALILPILLLNLYGPTKKLVRKHQRTFLRIDLMFHMFISIVGLLVLYAIEFLDHGFQGLCKNDSLGINHSHQLTLRTYQAHSFYQPLESHSCQGIIDFTNISFGLIVILLLDRQSEERKAMNFVVGMINKIYIFLLWVASIFYFHIPTKNFFRSIIVIIALTALVYVFDFVRAKRANKEQEKVLSDQQIPENEQQYEEQHKFPPSAQ